MFDRDSFSIHVNRISNETRRETTIQSSQENELQFKMSIHMNGTMNRDSKPRLIRK